VFASAWTSVKTRFVPLIVPLGVSLSLKLGTVDCVGRLAQEVTPAEVVVRTWPIVCEPTIWFAVIRVAAASSITTAKVQITLSKIVFIFFNIAAQVVN
jgi:hypothetical protein